MIEKIKTLLAATVFSLLCALEDLRRPMGSMEA